MRIMISETWFFKMDEDYGMGSFWAVSEWHDKFEDNKKYYMWVKTDYDTYRFTVEKKESKNISSDYDVWKMFNLIGIDAKNLHWEKSQITKVEAIPITEQITGPFSKIHWGNNFTSILSENSYIWIKVGDYYITPQFLDVPSFLYRELLLAWEKTGSRNDQLFLWFEEIIVPMAINRGKI